MTYQEKLKDPRWQKKRLEIMERDGFSCQACGDTKKTLHVHHRYYISGRMPWDYLDGNFQTRCCECHEHDGFDPENPFYEEWEVTQSELNCASEILLAHGVCLAKKALGKSTEEIVGAIAFWLTTKDSLSFCEDFNGQPHSAEFFSWLREQRGGGF